MQERQVKVNNRMGIHARPAAIIAKESSKFKCEILLKKDGMEINAKSILGIMGLGAVQGTEMIVYTEGIDEEEAIEKISKIISQEFELKDNEEV